MNDLKSSSSLLRWLPLRGQDWALLCSILLVFFCTALLDPNHVYYYKPTQSFWDFIRQIAPLGMLAVGVTVVIIGGGIDLSVASTATFCAMVAITVMQILAPEDFSEGKEIPIWITACGFGAAVLTGLMIGTIHAWMVTSLRIPPFIATLGTLVGLRSFARVLCNAVTKAYTDKNSAQFNIDNPSFDFLHEFVSVSVVVLLILVVVMWFVMMKTVMGRHLYALGGNEQAAALSGIRTENVKWFMYAVCSSFSAIAGIFYVAFSTNINTVSLANGKELNAIAAAVVGGCSLQGGAGTILGTVLGTIFLQAVVDAVSRIVKTDSATYEGLIVGIVVVLAVTFSQLRQFGAQGRQLFAGWLGLATIPILALSAGAIALITAGRNSGIGLGIVCLVIFSAMKFLETRRDSH